MILVAPDAPPVLTLELEDELLLTEFALVLLDEDEVPPVPDDEPELLLEPELLPEELAVELEELEELLDEEPVSLLVIDAFDVPVPFESTAPKLFPGWVLDVMWEFAATCLPLSISDTF